MVDKELIAIDRIFEKGKLTVDWFIGKRCNYDCSYCTPDIHDNSSPHLPLDSLINASNAFLKNFKPSNVKIGFTGGEPTVNPYFYDYCKHLFELGIRKISVTTNGTRTTKYFFELWEFVNNYTFSQHFEHASNSEFLPKVKELNDNKPLGKNLIVQVMFHSKYFEECKEAIEFYKKNNINYTLRRIRDKGVTHRNGLEYDEQQLVWFFKNQPGKDNISIVPGTSSKFEAVEANATANNLSNATIFFEENGEVQKQNVHVNEISGAEKNNFLGWTCWAGIDHLHIWWDGTVYRGNCQQGGSLGNIQDQNFELPIEPVICGKKRCHCAPEISVKKVRDMKYFWLIKD